MINVLLFFRGGLLVVKEGLSGQYILIQLGGVIGEQLRVLHSKTGRYISQANKCNHFKTFLKECLYEIVRVCGTLIIPN